MSKIIKNALNFSHELIKKCLQEGDIAVDATAGNGHDTVFLAKHVGKTGKVYAFDIQQQAIEATRERIMQCEMAEQVVLIHDGHEHMASYIKTAVKGILFNLGYLPGGDKKIVTGPEKTLKAVRDGLQLLCSEGLIILVVYYGHYGGEEEKEALLHFVKKLDQKQYTVLMYHFVNQHNNPPFLIAIEKHK